MPAAEAWKLTEEIINELNRMQNIEVSKMWPLLKNVKTLIVK